MLAHSGMCLQMLAYFSICQYMLTCTCPSTFFAHARVCQHLLASASIYIRAFGSICEHMLAYATMYWHILVYGSTCCDLLLLYGIWPHMHWDTARHAICQHVVACAIVFQYILISAGVLLHSISICQDLSACADIHQYVPPHSSAVCHMPYASVVAGEC